VGVRKQLLYTQMVKEKINDVIAGARSITEPWTASPRRRTLFLGAVYPAAALLQAISAERPVVLLIDEVDKSDPEFEPFCWRC